MCTYVFWGLSVHLEDKLGILPCGQFPVKRSRPEDPLGFVLGVFAILEFNFSLAVLFLVINIHIELSVVLWVLGNIKVAENDTIKLEMVQYKK